MTSLQKVSLGTPPTAVDGDTVRVANTKANANVDVLNAQSALTSAAQLVNSAQALTAVLHLGRRVNISLASAGTIQVPAASTCSTDGVMLLRNIGTTVVALAITTGSGDTLSLSKLNPGETALLDTDGVHAWTVIMRGRTNSDNETVNGNCSVGGNETVAGTLGVTGATTLSSLGVTGNATVGGALGVAGAATFTTRPTFASKTPWDNGNLASPVSSTNNAVTVTWVGGSTGLSYKVDGTAIGNLLDSSSAQTISGAKTFTSTTTANAQFKVQVASATVAYTDASLLVYGAAGTGRIGMASNNGASAFQLQCTGTTSTCEFVNFNASAYSNVTCQTLTQASDIRWKTNVETISGAMEGLRKVRGVRYTMNGARHVGVIAQEVKAAFPELIEELDLRPEGPQPEGFEPFLGVKYQNMIGPLLQGLLDTDALVQSLLARIAALEGKQ